MNKIRTTISPTQEIEVSDAELTDLQRRGLVLEGTRAHTEAGLTKAAVRQVLADDPDESAPPTATPPSPGATDAGNTTTTEAPSGQNQEN